MTANVTVPGSSRWSRVPVRGRVQPAPKDVRYFFLVVCSGGPKLVPLSTPRRLYTGDPIDPLVGLHYGNGTTPHDAQVDLTVEVPGVALGQLALRGGTPTADDRQPMRSTRFTPLCRPSRAAQEGCFPFPRQRSESLSSTTACTTTGPWNPTASTIIGSKTSRASRARISSGRWRRTAKGAAPGARRSGPCTSSPGLTPAART